MILCIGRVTTLQLLYCHSIPQLVMEYCTHVHVHVRVSVTGIDDEIRLGIELGYSLHHEVKCDLWEVTLVVAIVTCWTLDDRRGREGGRE